MTAIDDKHAQLPWIGNPKDEGAGSEEGPLPDGRGTVRDFDNGSIYWSPETGAYEVHGAIRDKYGQTRKWIGYPTTDETGCPDGVGRFNHFEHGSIYWTPETGAHEVHGAIRDSGRSWDGSGASSATRRPTSTTSPAAARATSRAARSSGPKRAARWCASRSDSTTRRVELRC